jgi:hypothetical protein
VWRNRITNGEASSNPVECERKRLGTKGEKVKYFVLIVIHGALPDRTAKCVSNIETPVTPSILMLIIIAASHVVSQV